MTHHTLLALPLAFAALIGQQTMAETSTPAIISQIEQQLDVAQAERLVPALLIAPIETTLASPMFGRVATHNASLGSSFKKGSLLIAFDCADRDAQVGMGEA